MFGYQTWPSVNSLKRDDEPVIAIDAVSTGALAARAYLRSVVFVEGTEQQATEAALGDHAQNLFEFVNAPWAKDMFCSTPMQDATSSSCKVSSPPCFHI